METKTERKPKRVFDPKLYTVRTNIPVPTTRNLRGLSPRKKFLMGLPIGASFEFPADDFQNFKAAASRLKQAAKEFNYRIVEVKEGTYGFWRDKPEGTGDVTEEKITL